MVKHGVGIRGRDRHARRSDGRAMRRGGDSLVGEEARRGRKGRDGNALKGGGMDDGRVGRGRGRAAMETKRSLRFQWSLMIRSRF